MYETLSEDFRFLDFADDSHPNSQPLIHEEIPGDLPAAHFVTRYFA
jgi:hypothetical protein